MLTADVCRSYVQALFPRTTSILSPIHHIARIRSIPGHLLKDDYP